MSGFDDRKRGEEARFAHDADLRFRAEARRNKLLGLWAAEQMGLDTDAEKSEYAAQVVAADFQEAGEEDVFRKVSADLKSRSVNVSDAQLRARMQELAAVARDQIISEG